MEMAYHDISVEFVTGDAHVSNGLVRNWNALHSRINEDRIICKLVVAIVQLFIATSYHCASVDTDDQSETQKDQTVSAHLHRKRIGFGLTWLASDWIKKRDVQYLVLSDALAVIVIPARSGSTVSVRLAMEAVVFGSLYRTHPPLNRCMQPGICCFSRPQ